jgi:hypothetical protein
MRFVRVGCKLCGLCHSTQVAASGKGVCYQVPVYGKWQRPKRAVTLVGHFTYKEMLLGF